MGETGLGLLIEEHRGEIVNAWRQAVARELDRRDPALAFAAAPLLREMALTLGGPGDAHRTHEAWTRCAVLVRSQASPAQLVREMKLLHRCIWEALRARGAPIANADRRAADEWLDEALAQALDRLERVRLRVAALERGPVVVPPVARGRVTPPPLPSRRRAPSSRAAAVGPEYAEPVDPRG